MSWLSKHISGGGNVLKKAASIAINTASGFVAGGNVGAIAGTARGVIENTKTSAPETINLRTAGQAFVTGGVANIAAGAIASGARGVVSAFNSGGAGGTGLFSQVGKSGGLSGFFTSNFGKIMSGAGSALKSSVPFLVGLLNKGGGTGANTSDPGSNPGSPDNTGLRSDFAALYGKVRNGYSAALGKFGLGIGNLQDQAIAGANGDLNPGVNGTAGLFGSGAAQAGIAGGLSPMVLLIAAAAAVFLLFKKKK